MNAQAPSTTAKPEPEYVPVDEEAQGANVKPTVTLFSLFTAANKDKKMADILAELEAELVKDPNAEGTASIKMWRPGAVIGRDAAILIAQKATNVKTAAKYMLAVAAGLEQKYGFVPVELYAEAAPNSGKKNEGKGSGAPRARGSSDSRYPKTQPGTWDVIEVKIIQINGADYLICKAGAGECKSKTSFFKDYDFSSWELKKAYEPPDEMRRVIVEKEGWIKRFE